VRTLAHTLLQDYVTRPAERSPDTVAVVMEQERITYGELECRSNRLGRALRETGCRPGDRVCLLIPKSIAAVVGMLGVLKADCVYVPLDVNSPAARLGKIIASCDTPWLLATATTSVLAGLLAQTLPLRVAWLGEAPPGGIQPAFREDEITNLSGERPATYNSPDSPAHILFTSGSTGQPKGVIITHANVHTFLSWATEYFQMTASDRNSGHSPLHFDLSTFDIYGSFAVGAELHLVPPTVNLLPNKLAEFIRRSELTQWFSVPSALTYMAKFDVIKLNDFPSLKRLLWCGEVLPTPTLMYWMQKLPKVRFTNLYGPTEATIASSYYTVPKSPQDPRARIPIGHACEGEELLVLGSNLQTVKEGEVGDLYIAGKGLSPGYWRDTEKTRAAFIQLEGTLDKRLYRTGDLAFYGADGLVYFAGRSDAQIKCRGHRVELGEIEAALNSLDWLHESAVVALEIGGFEGTSICCAYAARPDAVVTPTMLRKSLQALLPPYMLPSLWLELDALPKNKNGKIDRSALRKRFEAETRPAQAAIAEGTALG
jgi:amino acid adenylation domain-containing protein